MSGIYSSLCETHYTRYKLIVAYKSSSKLEPETTTCEVAVKNSSEKLLRSQIQGVSSRSGKSCLAYSRESASFAIGRSLKGSKEALNILRVLKRSSWQTASKILQTPEDKELDIPLGNIDWTAKDVRSRDSGNYNYIEKGEDVC